MGRHGTLLTLRFRLLGRPILAEKHREGEREARRNDTGNARNAMTERLRMAKTAAKRPARQLGERVEGRNEARRGMERLRNRWKQEGIGEPARRETGWDAAIIEEKQVIVERAGSADVVLSDKDPTLRGNYPHFYEDKNGELKYLYH